jgi:hypothetical protein
LFQGGVWMRAKGRSGPFGGGARRSGMISRSDFMNARASSLVVSVLVAALLSPAPLVAQKDGAGVALLSQATAALGAAGKEVATVTAWGRHSRIDTVEPLSVSFSVRVSGTENVRWDTEGEKGPAVTVVSGNGGWSLYDGRLHSLSVAETLGRSLEFFPALMAGALAGRSDVALSAPVPDQLLDRPVRTVTLSRIPASGSDELAEAFAAVSAREIVIDALTLLPAAVGFYDRARDWRTGSRVDLVYDDFRSVDGILFPFRVTLLRNGKATDVFELQSIALNEPVGQEQFNRPEQP